MALWNGLENLWIWMDNCGKWSIWSGIYKICDQNKMILVIENLIWNMSFLGFVQPGWSMLKI